jgi:excisionase family DNA binding protein
MNQEWGNGDREKEEKKEGGKISGRGEIGKNGEAGGGIRDGVSYRAGSLIFENRVEREWLSTREAAHYLRLSENALRIMVHRNQIRFHKFGRRLRFQLSDCQALFQQGGA